MKKIYSTFLILILLFCGLNTTFSEGSGTWQVDLSKMSAKQILEFYKKNKDFWKKRIELDYQKYIEGDWVVLRWEFLDEKGIGIPNTPVLFSTNDGDYIYTTNASWIFELEIKKNDIKDDQSYLITMDISNYKIRSTVLSWSDLKKFSVFHFKVIKKWVSSEEYILNLQNVHNNIFQEGSNWFIYKERIVYAPSLFWIQGNALVIIVWLIIVLLFALYIKHTFKRND